MRTTAATLIVFVISLFCAGSTALAEPIEPGETNISADHRTRMLGAKPMAKVGVQRVLIEQKMGMRVTKLRKGERLAPDAVPELNPNAAGLALALLAGGALLFVDRRRSTSSGAMLPAC